MGIVDKYSLTFWTCLFTKKSGAEVYKFFGCYGFAKSDLYEMAFNGSTIAPGLPISKTLIDTFSEFQIICALHAHGDMMITSLQ